MSNATNNQMTIQFKRLCRAVLFLLALAAVTLITGCAKTHYYAELSHGIYGAPQTYMLDTFGVQAQADTTSDEVLTISIFITRNMQIEPTDAVIDVICKDFEVLGDGKLMTAASLSCAPSTKIGAQMRVDATFAINGKRPGALLILAPTLKLSNLNADGTKTHIEVLRSFDVRLGLQVTTQSFSIR